MADRGWPEERSVRDDVVDDRRTHEVGETLPYPFRKSEQTPMVSGDDFAIIKGRSV